MLGRIVGDAGRGFGVDLDEQPSVNLAKVTTRSNIMVSNDGCEGNPLLDFGDADAGGGGAAALCGGDNVWQRLRALGHGGYW